MEGRKNKRDMILINAWVERSLKQAVAKAGVGDGMTVSRWVRKAIIEKLERDGK